MSETKWNIAVIGAGPAGSVAAIRLSQLGHRVTLFEKATFPRDKVCGECLSATGIAVLDRLGIGQAMCAALQPAWLSHARTVAIDGSTSAVALPESMLGLTRRAMDAWLLERARLIGATICFRSMTVPAIRERDGHAPNERHDFDAAVLADGRGAALSHAIPTGDFGIKAHFRDVDAARDAIELVALVGDGYAGLAPVNDNLWNAAWSVPAARLKTHAGDIESLFREALDRSPHLQRCFARATRVGDWLACPLPRHAVRRDWPRNVIPVGNAAAALEPVGGEGMGLAMRSAELAAEAIDAAARENTDVDPIRLRRQFDRLWRTRRAACRGAAIALSHPRWSELAVGIASRLPIFTRVGLALVGK